MSQMNASRSVQSQISLDIDAKNLEIHLSNVIDYYMQANYTQMYK